MMGEGDVSETKEGGVASSGSGVLLTSVEVFSVSIFSFATFSDVLVCVLLSAA